ncbi:hypothetical protein A9Q98_12425 [Thalassotalea sp. 42_200_T64]|nr:hypothetical protein A9Q98_12425 [Thalassotalea sp. 42_200_T64]
MFRKFHYTPIPILLVIAGVAVSALLGCFFYEQEENAITVEFRNDIDKRAASLYREIVINFEVLRSLAILFNREDVPQPELFEYEAAKILSRHKGIQALEWIPHVPHSQRKQYELALKREFPDFEFTERREQGAMVSAKKREEYFPVYYVEPLSGNELALGFDLASNVIRRGALHTSRDLGIPQATSSITLVQETAAQKGFLAFLPVYDGLPTTELNRRNRLKGFVLGVFRIGDIFSRSALSQAPLGVEMKLVDETSQNDISTLYIQRSREGLPAIDRISYKKMLPDIWGRSWSLLASPTTAYISVRRSLLPLLIFVSITILSFAIAIYIYIIANRSATINRLVIKKTRELNEANKKLERVSQTDGLTDVANRRYMDQYLAKEWQRAIRNQSTISFALIDIDYFKLYNDNYGHPAGDECIKKVATSLKSQLQRPNDFLARYGGEEFALVLPETTNAEPVVHRCRQAIEDLQIKHEYSDLIDRLSISIGLCSVIPEIETDPSVIINAADKALYKAKKAGRNRVEIGEIAEVISPPPLCLLT